MRFLTLVVLAAGLAEVPAYGQSPATAPLVLSVPASARVEALGGAWVTGRDQDVLFFNPAQLVGLRSDFNVSLARLGPSSSMGALTSVYAAGRLSATLAWGVQTIAFKTREAGSYPYTQDDLIAPGTPGSPRNVDAQSTLATVGGAIVFKGFRMGAAAKYAADRAAISRRAWLADLGVAHNLFGGVAGVAAQNLGASDIADGNDVSVAKIPRQIAFGWSTTKQAGPLDVGIFSQVTTRSGWTAPAAGLEVGYSWIEGYLVTLRAGARRPDSAAGRPMTIGAGFTADRFTLDYALEWFDGNRRAHRVTIRWR